VAASGTAPGEGAWRGEPMSGATTMRARAGAGTRGTGQEHRQQTTGEEEPQPTQEMLPPLRWLLQPDANRFAHPAEVELARLLTFYGVRWSYEPTTFALKWGSDGRPEEFVTPDFFLPDHDLYLELTTMRQRLVTRKNRKFRLLRQHYPNVRVRLLYLRDYERIREIYGTNGTEQEGRLGSVLLDEREVEQRVSELACELRHVWEDRPRCESPQRPLVLGLGPGSDHFIGALAERLREQGVAVDLDRADLTSLAGAPGAERVRLSRAPALPVAGRTVVIGQEVISSGLSAAFIRGWLQRRGAAVIDFCALLDREAARIIDVPITCRGFVAPDVALAGYGLARRREYRGLPYIAEIETG
jgi:hypoxanthine-guanine phosphoribosyltransferase